MNNFFSAAMRKATQLTREQNLVEATNVIRRALRRRDQSASEQPVHENGQVIELKAEPAPSSTGFQQPAEEIGAERAGPWNAAARMKRPLREVLADLRKFARDFPGDVAPPLVEFGGTPSVQAPDVVQKPDGARYLTRSFVCEAGARDYSLYVPSQTGGRKPPLIVMLHGCTQDADDFAVGTGMNRLAEQHGFVVAYPSQATQANQMNCWNWFDPKDQMRDRGEPRIIAGITREIIAEFNIDPERVFVAGLSAGGAMAEIMGVAYPELYAATGVHSGVAYGSASNIASAFAAMKGAAKKHATARKAGVRTIIFHGTTDRTVHPSNARAILDQARAGLVGAAQETQIDGSAGGRGYTRTIIADRQGVPHVEHWAIEGLGHAWSGGSPEGSHTDPRGPDASREMLRFFLNEAAGSSTD
jgi:poly(hydroxyalkanoate) depolymerase family esterase